VPRVGRVAGARWRCRVPPVDCPQNRNHERQSLRYGPRKGKGRQLHPEASCVSQINVQGFSVALTPRHVAHYVAHYSKRPALGGVRVPPGRLPSDRRARARVGKCTRKPCACLRSHPVASQWHSRLARGADITARCLALPVALACCPCPLPLHAARTCDVRVTYVHPCPCPLPCAIRRASSSSCPLPVAPRAWAASGTPGTPGG
jgi:hypothetical protein